jgi:adenosine deaminase
MPAPRKPESFNQVTERLIKQLTERYSLSDKHRDVLFQVQEFPKTELHVHVEGATPPATFWHMAQKNQQDLGFKSPQDWEAFFNFQHFNHFIQVYVKATDCIQTPVDYTALVNSFFEEQARRNIIYTEAFISCSLSIGKFDASHWLDCLEQGLIEGHTSTGVAVKLIADVSRERPETQEAVLAMAIEGHKRGIFVGLGLGGLEKEFPARQFENLYTEARRNGLRLTVHAGEAAGPESLWEALELLGAERIGHGIRCLEDPMLVEHLRKAQIPLDVSPISNYCTGVVEKKVRHPIHQLIEEGLFVTLNTDDPSMFQTSYLHETALLLHQGMEADTLFNLLEANVKARFV